MTITIERARNWITSTANDISAKAEQFNNYILSHLDQYSTDQKEVEASPFFTERDILEMKWNEMTMEGPVGIEECDACYNQTLLSKIMNLWNKYTGLSYLSERLDNLSIKYNIRLYKSYTYKLLFNDKGSMFDKTIQIVSSLFGITHLSLITTLVVNELFLRLEKKVENLPVMINEWE